MQYVGPLINSLLVTTLEQVSFNKRLEWFPLPVAFQNKWFGFQLTYSIIAYLDGRHSLLNIIQTSVVNNRMSHEPKNLLMSFGMA